MKYIDQVVRFAPADVRFSYFSWRKALLGRYDVFHVHWPEYLLRSASRSRRPLKRILFEALLLRLRLTGTRVVRTVHNVEPHEPGPAGEARLLARLDALVDEHVVLSATTPIPTAKRVTHIPHGHFRDVFAHSDVATRVRGRLLLFGRIEPYKGASDLLRERERFSGGDIELRFVGKASRPIARAIDRIDGQAQVGARVSSDLRRVPDDVMVAEMSAAEAMILPYRDAGNGNSGVGLVALSLDTPIIVTRSPLMTELAAEVGEGWVVQIDEVTAEAIEAALWIIRDSPRSGRPDLSRRSWQEVARAYSEVFRRGARSGEDAR